VAHEGAVTGLLATQDGLSLLSSGMDHRVRLWDAGETYVCTMLSKCLHDPSCHSGYNPSFQGFVAA
jgi:hypothetical protein